MIFSVPTPDRLKPCLTRHYRNYLANPNISPFSSINLLLQYKVDRRRELETELETLDSRGLIYTEILIWKVKFYREFMPDLAHQIKNVEISQSQSVID